MRRRRRGFTLLECLIAMFIMLVGLLGVVSVFSAGLQAQLLAQETFVSQQLANMWAEWIRFRLNNNPSSAVQPAYPLKLSDLAQGANGDFYADTGSSPFYDVPGGSSNLPTYNCNAYRSFKWQITAADQNYKPKWIKDDGTPGDTWEKGLSGPLALAKQPTPLAAVDLTISRGARSYVFHYVFSGVGLRYAKL